MLKNNQDQLDEQGDIPEGEQPEASGNNKKSFLAYLNPIYWFVYLYKHYKWLLFGGVGILLSALLAGIAYHLLTNSPTNANESATSDAPRNINYYPLPDIKLRMRRENGGVGYLVMGITLKVSDQFNLDNYRKFEPEILDVLHTYLSSINLDDFSSVSWGASTSPVGLERVRINVTRRLNGAVPQLKIESILFRKLIIQ